MKNMNTFFATLASLVLASGIASAQTPTPSPAPTANDGEILGLVNTLNDAEVEAGKVAVDMGQDSDVKKFAAKMVTEHTANNLKITALETKAGLKRAESDASRQLEQNAKTMIDNLKNAKSADFDKAYIDSQVTMHQDALNTLDQSLIPSAQNADVKSFLQETRDVIAEHLKEAQELQKELAKP